MSERESTEITQKDLLKLLFDQAQHNATREEVQAVQEEIKETNKRFDGLATREEALLLESKMTEHIESVRTEASLRSDRLEDKIDKLNDKIDTTAKGLNEKIESTAKELKGEITHSENRINKRMDELQTQFKTLDMRMWGIAVMIVGLAFKTEIMAWLG